MGLASSALPSQQLPTPAAGPEPAPGDPVVLQDVVVISPAALSLQWRSGLVGAVRHLMAALDVVEQATRPLTATPPAALTPLIVMLGAAAQEVGVGFAAPPPPRAGSMPDGAADARPAPGAGHAAGAEPSDVRPPLPPAAPAPAIALGTAGARADMAAAVAGYAAAAAPAATPDTLPGKPPAAADGGRPPPPQPDPAPNGPTPANPRHLGASPDAPSLAAAGATPLSAGEAALAALTRTSDVLVLAQARVAGAAIPDLAGADPASSPDVHELGMALVQAQSLAALAAGQVAAFLRPLAGGHDALTRRVRQPGAALWAGLAGEGLGDMTDVLRRTRRALTVALICAAGVAVAVAATLDLSLMRAACALALVLLGLAAAARWLHRRPTIRLTPGRAADPD